MKPLRPSIARLLLLCALVLPAAGPHRAQPHPPVVTGDEDVRPEQPAGERRVEGGRQVRTYTLAPEKYEKAVAYSRARYRLHFLGFAYGVLVLFLLLALRVSAKFRDLAERASRRRFVQAVVFAPLVILTLYLLGLPLDAYGQHLALRYEQSVQGWASWLWDWAKDALIHTAVGTLLVWLLYAFIRRSPRRWWLYFWLISLPIIIFLVFIAPLVIQPLFFRFEPLAARQPALVAEIEKVVARGGLSIPRERMFEMNAGEKLKSLNAYVTGFGGSKRVVVWDTTIQKMTVPQTLFVFGHEMGHYVLNHVLMRIAFLAGLVLLMLLTGYLALRRMLRRRGAQWRVRAIDDWASLPALLLIFSLVTFLAEPLLNGFSRRLEHQADIYGLEVIHGVVPDSSRAAAEAFQVLGEINLADPDPGPFIKYWLYSHPPLKERIEFAYQYDPWTKNQEPRFVR